MQKMTQKIYALAVEASGRSASVAVADEAGVISTHHRQAQHDHAQHIMALVEKCLADAAIGAGAVTHIAAGCGPGSFTGIRTAIATAKGMGLGLAVPVYGIGSLAALYQAAEKPGAAAQVLVAVDSRRAGYFARVYDNGKAITPLFEASKPEFAKKVLAEVKAKPLHVIGHDSQLLADMLAQAGVAVAGATETDANASAIADYARGLIVAGKSPISYPPQAHYHTPVLLGDKKADKKTGKKT